MAVRQSELLSCQAGWLMLWDNTRDNIMTRPLPFAVIHRFSRSCLRWSAIALLGIALSACGFQMRTATPLPFDTLYINVSDNSDFGATLYRHIQANSPHTRIVTSPEEADARLLRHADRQLRRELSIDAAGYVEEYELTQEITFELQDGQGRTLLPITRLATSRDMPYDPDDSQAKRQEMDQLFQTMRLSLIDRIIQRISSKEVIEAYERTHPDAH